MKEEITTHTTEIQRLFIKHYEQLYDNSEKTEKFLQIYNLPELNQEEI